MTGPEGLCKDHQLGVTTIKHIIKGFAAASIAALMSTVAFAQTAGPGAVTPTTAGQSVRGCSDISLLAGQTKTIRGQEVFVYNVKNEDIEWRTPMPALKKDGKWILPDDKVAAAAEGYNVLVRLAEKCPLRFTVKYEKPDVQAYGGPQKW